MPLPPYPGIGNVTRPAATEALAAPEGLRVRGGVGTPLPHYSLARTDFSWKLILILSDLFKCHLTLFYMDLEMVALDAISPYNSGGTSSHYSGYGNACIGSLLGNRLWDRYADFE